MTKQMRRMMTLVAATFFLFGVVVDADAQRRPVTTHPGKKQPCEDKIESSVDKTPWKVNGISIMTVQTTPIDTVDIVAGAEWVQSITGGNIEDYQTIVDSIQGSMSNLSLVVHYQWTRTVHIVLKEWKCIDGALVLVRDIDRKFDEKTPWQSFGPLTGSTMSAKRIRTSIAQIAATLPTEYEGPIE